MTRWFRFYDTVLDDPKVQRLSDKHFRAWVNLLCVASKNDGLIPSNFGDIAFSLRISEGEARNTLQVLISAGLMEQGDTTHAPHNWSARQFKGDVSTERVKRFRERSMKRDETVSETPPDTDTDTEVKEEPSEPKTVLQDAPSGKPQGDVVEPEASKALKKVRDDLWSEGTALLGEKNRAALGEAVKLSGGELAAVLDTVRRCAAGVREGTITGNRVAWVMREVRPFKSDQHAQGPPKEPAYLQLARDKFGIA